jgi:NDP-sugar pyrophosphorylase family protein
MTVFRNEGRWDTSNVWFEDGVIKSYDKKQRTPEMQYIDYGLGLFDSRALSSWPSDRAFDLAEIYRDLVCTGALAGYEVAQRFYEIGSAQGLAELDALLRKEQLSAST